MKKMTRKQKVKTNPNGSGNSTYSAKKLVRVKLAHRLNVSPSLPMPVLKAIELDRL